MSNERPNLTVEDLRNIVSRITYKPNFIIEVFHGDKTYLRIAIIMKVANVQSGEIVEISMNEDIDFGFMSSDTFVWYVHGMIHSMEAHECNEWFKFEGSNLVDPHPEFKKEAA